MKNEEDMTIDQVAELAYVSRSVVSRVLNDHPNVSDEARERVLKVIEEHDYRPNSVARSLATDRSFEISILTPRRSEGSPDHGHWPLHESLANGYWPLLYSGIFDQCLERGYFVSLSIVSAEMEDKINARAGDKRFDGYVLITQEVTDFVGSVLQERGAPTILIGQSPDQGAFHSIDIDNETGGYKAGAHFCGLGYQEVGMILGDPDLEETKDRRRGLERALDESGCPVSVTRVGHGDYSQGSGYDLVHRWASEGSLPRALFCASDTMAAGALLALHETGHHVPDDVAVVGFDGLPSSRYTIPPLTTVRQPVYDKGKAAVDMLVDEIEESSSTPVHRELEPELVVRESCGAGD
jgi:LacI family purine nucleotide synthesis repressor